MESFQRFQLKHFVQPPLLLNGAQTVEQVVTFIHDGVDGGLIMENEKVIGLLMKNHLIGMLNKGLGIHLFMHRSVTYLMKQDFLILDAQMTILEAGALAMKRPSGQQNDCMVVMENGQLLGTVSIYHIFIGLMEMTQFLAIQQSESMGKIIRLFQQIDLDMVRQNEITKQTIQESSSLLDTADLGRHVTQEMSVLSSSMKEKMLRQRDKVNELKQFALHIPKYVKEIQQMSSQIQLLAMNATIEASRAGEYGRGFTVVANEIRSLSEGTKRTVTEIAEMFKRIEQTIIQTNQFNQESESELAETLQSVEQTKEILLNIFNKIQSNQQDLEEGLDHSSQTMILTKEAKEAIQQLWSQAKYQEELLLSNRPGELNII
ncbi:methyl-accepting chemotaxis protein [Tepidibacillus marianensis]|uniref:methyl-accepting chemotaxis protein n=1 Tax=Tepidibacillus marianensis TaxID=3131995 RepID=UPI0030CD398B